MNPQFMGIRAPKEDVMKWGNSRMRMAFLHAIVVKFGIARGKKGHSSLNDEYGKICFLAL